MRNIYNNIGNSLYHDNMAIYKYYNVSFLPSVSLSENPRMRAFDATIDQRSRRFRCVHFSPVVSRRLVNLFKRTGRDENVSSFQFRRACHADTRSPFLTTINQQRVHPFNRSLSLSAETACVYTYVYEREGRRVGCVCVVCGVWCVGGRETVGKGEREQGVRSWYILRVFFFIRTRMYVERRKWRRRIKAKEEKRKCPEISRRSLLNTNNQNNSSKPEIFIRSLYLSSYLDS